MDNYAAVLHGPCDLRIENVPIPEINDEEVLIKISCVGICGTDVKLYYSGKCGLEVVEAPMVIGHEGAGVVAKVGDKVRGLKIGDRVAIEPTQPCRRCEFCRAGRYNLCDGPRYCSTPDGPGNICRYYKHVADFCHKLPENVSLEEGAAIQPLAIALHACNRAGITLGSSLVILGAGPIGVLCAMTAKAMGAAKILMTDVVQSRLDIAKKLAADYTVLVKSEYSDEEIVEKIIQTLGGRPRITIDACAFPSAQRVSMLVTKKGGTVLIVGIGDTTVEVPLSGTVLREIDIRGSNRIVNTYGPALAAVASGKINIKQFITHHFPMEKTEEAIQLAKTGAAMKIIIHVK
ncbi:sorbitol dehydrogenase-like [Battus philenor]|uniref:sorbitol dehydrogenase-like n=1 Tax=Battus philenor TaxID=42288 RepID=UPI0035CF642D